MEFSEQNLPEWQPPSDAPAGRALAPTIDPQGRINIYRKDLSEKDLPEWTPAVSEATGKPFTWRDTWPVQLATRAWHAANLPGDITSGKFDTQPSTPGMLSDEDVAKAQMNSAEEFHR